MALYRSFDYQIKWPFGSGEEFKIDGHLGFLIGTILALFYKVTLMLSTKFGDN